MFKIMYLISGDGYTGARRVQMTIGDEDTGDPVDISATDLVFRLSSADGMTIFEKSTDTPDEIERASPQVGALLGVCYITIEPADTDALGGRYVWELEGIEAGKPKTLGKGACYIKVDLIGVAS